MDTRYGKPIIQPTKLLVFYQNYDNKWYISRSTKHNNSKIMYQLCFCQIMLKELIPEHDILSLFVCFVGIFHHRCINSICPETPLLVYIFHFGCTLTYKRNNHESVKSPQWFLPPFKLETITAETVYLCSLMKSAPIKK